jgi:GNAT superfamily N-acetyltransferase
LVTASAARSNDPVSSRRFRTCAAFVQGLFETRVAVERLQRPGAFARQVRDGLDRHRPPIPFAERRARMAGRRILVVEEGGEVAGFAELEEDGHLDMLYVRKDAVGRGVGRRLYGRSSGGQRSRSRTGLH